MELALSAPKHTEALKSCKPAQALWHDTLAAVAAVTAALLALRDADDVQTMLFPLFVLRVPLLCSVLACVLTDASIFTCI